MALREGQLPGPLLCGGAHATAEPELTDLESKQLQLLSPKELHYLDVIVRSGIAETFSYALRELHEFQGGQQERSR
jgi:hypothetical protein